MVQSLWDRIPEVEKHPEILTRDLTLADVPPPQSSWSTIANFAFNYPWEQVGKSFHALIPGFREATALWQQSGCLPKDLHLLRQYVFVLQRSIRWNEGSITDWDDGPEIRYAQAYVDAIRRLL